MSLNKDILFRQITKYVTDLKLIWLTDLIIFNDPTNNFTSKSDKALFDRIPPHKSLFHIPKNQGLPIGNLTSQFFANVYLNELDQFAKRKLNSKYYLRYVDDIIFLSSDKEQLKEWAIAIDNFIKENLCLELNHKKQILQSVDKGVDWLGYIVKPSRGLVRPRVVRAFKRKLYLINQQLSTSIRHTGGGRHPDAYRQNTGLDSRRSESSVQLGGGNDTDAHDIRIIKGQLLLPFSELNPPLELIEKILATVNSYFGFFRHADTFKLRKKLWEKHFGLIRNYLEPKEIDDLVNPRELVAFQIKPEYIKKIRESQTDFMPISERTQRT